MKPSPFVEDRLYGPPHAESMSFDLASAYESQDYWTGSIIEHPERVVVEEWTVAEPISLLPKPLDALDYLIERHIADDVVECVWDNWVAAAADPDVVASMQATLELLASKVTGRMADRLVATHVITFDGDGEPILNGERLYRPVKRFGAST